MITRREDLTQWVKRVRALTRDLGGRSTLTRSDRVASALAQGQRREERVARNMQELDHYLASVEASLEVDAAKEAQ